MPRKNLETDDRQRSLATALVALLAAILVGVPWALTPIESARAADADTVFGVNLIANPGAEAGLASSDGSVLPVPGWTTSGSFTAVQYQPPETYRFPTTTTSGPEDRGANFFAGGPGDTESSASQTIDVSSAGTVIDRGGVTYRMIAYLGGFNWQNDSATFAVEFRNAEGTYLGSEVIGGPAGSGDRDLGLFANPSYDRYVPQGTRSIYVELRMQVVTPWTDGYIDGYADNVSLVLVAPPTADIAVSTSDSPDPARHRAPFTHRIDAVNLGPDTSAGTSLDVVYPRDAQLLATSVAPCGSAIPPDPDDDPHYYFCIGQLAPGAAAAIELVFEAKKRGSYTTSVTANDLYDRDYSNNSASETTSVVPRVP